MHGDPEMIAAASPIVIIEMFDYDAVVSASQGTVVANIYFEEK